VDPSLSALLSDAAADCLVGAALVDPNERVIAIGGTIDEDEAVPFAKFALHRARSEDLKARLFAGEIVTTELDDRYVAVAVARRQLFVVAIVPVATPAVLDRVRKLRDRVAAMLDGQDGVAVPSARGSGGSNSGPAELSLVEYGITITRERGKA
jgi:hypothetical protein